MSAPRLLDQVRQTARLRHLSLRTERAYTGWVYRFVVFHGKRHPSSMGAVEVRRFLSHLATEGRVSASTQNQALCAVDKSDGAAADDFAQVAADDDAAVLVYAQAYQLGVTGDHHEEALRPAALRAAGLVAGLIAIGLVLVGVFSAPGRLRQLSTW